ncbi:hypothetical protein MMC30_001947 [Trapelia coarctata]|nr:hypothetical protein [Trapelia coarctata]
MPSFYPSNLPRQLPLTPPDYYNPHQNCMTGALQLTASSFYGHGGADTRYGIDGRDKFGYTKQPVYPAIVPSTHTAYTKEVDSQGTSNYIAPFAHSENAYGHIAPPVLPPIRIPDRGNTNIEQVYHQNNHTQRIQPQAQPKEEKVAGGVAAHLDYDMELMVDFVSEMAQGMYDLFQSHICLADIDISRSVQPSASVSAEFRKYVSQILTSTRLPSSTVLLGLHYLSARMTMLSSNGIYSSSTGHLYHMLTTALMLGSKFLDDNTFQNRSWAEVSHISVAELNVLEMDWLIGINWDLHIDSADQSGLPAWMVKWSDWQTKRVEITLDSLKLTPLDSSLQRQHSLNKQLPPTPIYSTYADSMYSMVSKDRVQSIWQAPREQWPPVRNMTERSPPSAPESGPNTPDWYARQGFAGYGQAATQSMRNIPALQPLQVHPSSTQSPYYTPYAQQFTPSPWSGHGMGCMCGYCLPYHDRFSMGRAYGAQTVAG